MRAATSAARDANYLKSFERHRAAWGKLWQVCDLKVSGNERVQLLLRL
jgi:trehalose/maltose hydrolase-like predicted phosphorylase